MPIDIQKYTKNESCAVIRHNERDNKNYSNTDIDITKTPDNYSLIEREKPYSYLKSQVESYDKINPPKRVRQDRIIMDGFIFTPPEEIVKQGREDEYFKHCVDWMKKTYGEDNIVYAYIHKDEVHRYYDKLKQDWVMSRQHMHAGVIPLAHDKERGDVVNSKKFNSRDNWKKWNRQLDEYIYQKMGIHDLQKTEKAQCGRDMVQLKAESAIAGAKEIERIDKELSELDKVYEYEVGQMQEGIAQAEKDAEARIQTINKEADQKIVDAQKRATKAEQDAQKKIEEMDKELTEAEVRFERVKHDMNTTYKEKKQQLDKIVGTYENKIDELYDLAERLELDVFTEQAHKLEHTLERIVNDDYER